jgi:hypothetical protein
MSKIITLILILCIAIAAIGQSTHGISARVGGLYFDAQPDEGDIFRDQAGLAFISEISYTRSFDWSGPIDPSIRVGYSAIIEATSDMLSGFGGSRATDRLDFHYLHIGYGVDYSMTSKVGLSLHAVHYVFMPLDLYKDSQRRAFMNVEPGIFFKLSERSRLSFASPLSITRPNGDGPVRLVLPSGNEFSPNPEMNGLIIGWHHTL